MYGIHDSDPCCFSPLHLPLLIDILCMTCCLEHDLMNGWWKAVYRVTTCSINYFQLIGEAKILKKSVHFAPENNGRLVLAFLMVVVLILPWWAMSPKRLASSSPGNDRSLVTHPSSKLANAATSSTEVIFRLLAFHLPMLSRRCNQLIQP